MAKNYVKLFSKNFEMLDKAYNAASRRIADMVKGKSTTPLVLEGPAGVGKTTIVNNVLRDHKHKRFQIIAGKITPLALYMNLYQLRNKGDVLILDDTDTALDNIDALNILKAATDSKPVREVSWVSTRSTTGVPGQFTTEGSIIILSNASFTHTGKAKKAAHLKAIMSRAFCLTISDDDNNHKFIQICYMVYRHGMLIEMGKKAIDEILTYLDNRKETFKQFDLRTALKLAELYKSEPDSWSETADFML